MSSKVWSNLAKIVYRRTYARKDTGIVENWDQTVERTLQGNFRNVLEIPHLRKEALEEMKVMRKLMINRKSGPAGRGYWFSGAPAHEKIGGVALCNCWYLTADSWENFVISMDLLMLGGGVGLGVEHQFVSKLPRIKKEVSIVHKPTKDADFIVPDSREGWCELLRRALEAYFVTGKSFSYSTVCVRGYGESITGFGGTSSGPLPLIAFINNINKILGNRAGKTVRPIDAADLICATGEMVVSGNVRRSAIIIIGDPFDKEYLKAKRWDLGPVPTYRATANFSVICEDVENDLSPLFWKTYENGEPFGLVNRKNMQVYGRMGEFKEDTAVGVNPSLRAGTKVWSKEFGMANIETLEGKTFTVKNLNGEYSEAECWLSSPSEILIKVTLEGGSYYYATEKHEWPVLSEDEISVTKKKTIDLKTGMQLPRLPYQENISSGTLGTYEDGKIIGYFYGDGWITVRKDNGKVQYGVCIPKNRPNKMLYLDKFKKLFNGEGSYHAAGTIEFNSASVKVNEYFNQFGTQHKSKGLPTKIWTECSNDFINGFIEGMSDSDGCKGSNKDNRFSVNSASEKLIDELKELLGFKGIFLNKTITHKKTYTVHKKVYNKETTCYTLRRKWEVACSGKPVKILSIEVSNIKEPVWDIRVKDTTHCFQISDCVTGNCAEATLSPFEPCNLAEQALSNIEDEKELILSSRMCYRYAKRVTMEHYHHEQVQKVIEKNRRVGVGITGCLESPLFNPKTLNAAYQAIQAEDEKYSSELGISRSIRTTVIKPSGTMSKVLDQRGEGIHAAFSRFMIQRIRVASNDPLIPLLRAAGHHMEPVVKFDGTMDMNTLVVDFYLEAPDDMPCADEGFDTWKQLDVLLMAQKYWADQAVSVTVYYKKEELLQIKEWLKDNFKYLKTISFLCHNDHGFKQAPKEAITKEKYEELSSKVKPIDVEKIEGSDLESLECAGGFCPIK